MQLWKALYGTVWLAFFSIVLLPRWMGAYIGFPVHILLGLILLFAALGNARRLAALSVPPRLKRISKVTAGFAVFQVVFGAAFGAAVHYFPGSPYLASVLQGVHIVCALAILAQASSVATAYDMWEEKEFEEI
jgi:hypothetical protein